MRQLIFCAVLASVLTACEHYETAAPVDEVTSRELPTLGDDE